MFSLTPPEWFDNAPCRGKDRLFFSSLPTDRKRAIGICESQCPNVRECLDFAVSESLTLGVWGGKTGPEISRLVHETL